MSDSQNTPLLDWKSLQEELDLMTKQKLPVSKVKIQQFRKELESLQRKNTDYIVQLEKLQVRLSQHETIKQEEKHPLLHYKQSQNLCENKSLCLSEEYFQLLSQPQMIWHLGVVVEPFPERFTGWFLIEGSSNCETYKAHGDNFMFPMNNLPNVGQSFWFRAEKNNAVQLFEHDRTLNANPIHLPMFSTEIEYGHVCLQEDDEKYPFVLIQTSDSFVRIAPLSRSYWLILHRTDKLLSFPVQFIVRDNVATCVRAILGNFQQSTFYKTPSSFPEAQCIYLSETMMTIQTSNDMTQLIPLTSYWNRTLLRTPFRIYVNGSDCLVIDQQGTIQEIRKDHYEVVSDIDGFKYTAPFCCSISQFKLQDKVRFRLFASSDFLLAINLV